MNIITRQSPVYLFNARETQGEKRGRTTNSQKKNVFSTIKESSIIEND